MWVIIGLIVIIVIIGLCYWLKHYRKEKKELAASYLGKNRDNDEEEPKEENSKEST